MPTDAIPDVIKQLEMLEAQDSKNESENVISEVLTRLREISTDEAANLLRNDVNRLRMRPDLSSDTKKLLYQVTLAIAHDYPINTECPITQESIKEGNEVFTSTGHQFDLDAIFTWISSKDRAKNPLAGDLFTPEDIEHICEKKGYSLSMLRTMISQSNNDDPQGLNQDAIHHALNGRPLLDRDTLLAILLKMQPQFIQALVYRTIVPIDKLPMLRQQHYQAFQQHQAQLLNLTLSFQDLIALSNKPQCVRDLVRADILPISMVNGLSELQLRAFEQYLPELLRHELSLDQATAKMAKQEAFNAMTPEQQLEAKKEEELEAKRKEEQERVEKQYCNLHHNRPAFISTLHHDWCIPLTAVLTLSELQVNFLEKNASIMVPLFKDAGLRLEQALKLTEKELELFKKVRIRELAYFGILFLGSKADLNAEQLQAYNRSEILLLEELSNLTSKQLQALIDNRIKLANKEISLFEVIGERNDLSENKLEQASHNENVISTPLSVHGLFPLQPDQSVELLPRLTKSPQSIESAKQALEKENTVNSNAA